MSAGRRRSGCRGGRFEIGDVEDDPNGPSGSIGLVGVGVGFQIGTVGTEQTDGKAITLMLVDDHAVVRMGLKAMLGLEADFEVVAEAEDAEEAVRLYAEHQPDVMLLDLRMPGDSGVVVVQRLRARYPEARIIMLTSFDLEEEVFQSLDAGAQGYVLKSMEPEELVMAIRGVHAGERWVPPALERRLEERAGTKQLSPRELEVLDGMRRGLSNRDIGMVLGISEHTAKNHSKSIFKKLQVADRAEAVAVGFERGLLHPESA